MIAQVQGSFQDVRAPPLTISTLQSLISLPLIRPELFRKGILKKNFIPGVLLFGPPGTGKVYTYMSLVQLQLQKELTFLWVDHVGQGCGQRQRQPHVGHSGQRCVSCKLTLRALPCTHRPVYCSYEMYVGQGEKNVKVHKRHTHTHAGGKRHSFTAVVFLCSIRQFSRSQESCLLVSSLSMRWTVC